MPNASISVYLIDEDYIKYLEKKASINAKVRELVKEMLHDDIEKI